MEDFLAAIILKYFNLSLSSQALAKELQLAGGIDLVDQSPAGAWANLPRCKYLEVGNSGVPRVNTGLWAKVNGAHMIDILVYVENSRIKTVEFAAPLNDFPKSIDQFEFVEFPVKR